MLPSNGRRSRRSQSRPSLTTLATGAVVAYGTYRLASWAWEAFQQQQHGTVEIRRERQDRWQLRRERMTRCQEECRKALEGFLPTMRKFVEERTSTREETAELKRLRQADRKDRQNAGDVDVENKEQEKRLWNIIQTRLLTRLVATAYAHNILFLVLTVQINLLGGRLLEEQLDGPTASSPADTRVGSYQASHHFVLTHTYEYFFDKGLGNLVDTVERSVADLLSNDWNVMDRSSLYVTRKDVEDKIAAIRGEIEGGGKNQRTRPRSLIRFLMPPSAHVETEEIDDELASNILDETWDLLESPIMTDAQRDCLGTTFEMMRDSQWGKLFISSESDGEDEPVTIPLATIIPRLKKTASSFYESTSSAPTVNSYCSMMQALPTVLELCDASFN